ncbi:Polyketide cyclase/dehydrase [Gordonia bronchialis DSM 43247]|uniref:Polyketide cyclase/dehydrase n=1 Tax=Gordonia bronchialis (strain ATCC 25592 / DSM 43247 / BCRC 13721 / JCM 3198 / KCTC 3076 / NBRC 16047 / NCTC 10667) TaxID=526226 RepID=D0LDE4_GORB4|nr:SRPBCC family protein [Gordonia bronchialis]ACY19764.1 Polyketide cyclase/dehydrase [Gordonia bronchialis DSM 43247]MCC3322538.1 SRPBCC family protein [Gordonia bronchialis]QGS26350.1 SRPBCC family protein [Gordonia bronchialis]UAK37303.1 SRPBCC family protein [Gordonia bronchialis]STQ62534.1 Polyketide cyclase / dehydrase and lipid transport [Gordonia bronchialis]
MGQISATQSIDIAAAPDAVIGALADYNEVRPAILPEQYRDYAVIKGGNGDGTVVHWILQATSKRQRDVKATVSVVPDTVTERDENSTMVTTYQVSAAGNGSKVTTTTTWNSQASGIGGFFEKTFAPKGLARIQAALLANLKKRLES